MSGGSDRRLLVVVDFVFVISDLWLHMVVVGGKGSL